MRTYTFLSAPCSQEPFLASFADVQPYYITYAESWTYQAFDIRIENGVFHGRGVTDPKGNVLMAIHVSPSFYNHGGRASLKDLHTLVKCSVCLTVACLRAVICIDRQRVIVVQARRFPLKFVSQSFARGTVMDIILPPSAISYACAQALEGWIANGGIPVNVKVGASVLLWSLLWYPNIVPAEGLSVWTLVCGGCFFALLSAVL